MAEYPKWLYSAVDPPQYVTGPAQAAALPSGFSSTPVVDMSPEVMPRPAVIATVNPGPVPVNAKVTAPMAPVVVFVKRFSGTH